MSLSEFSAAAAYVNSYFKAFSSIISLSLMGIRNTIERIRRVLLVSNKPDKYEYKQTVKITGLGIAVIGVIGFVIFLAVQAIGGL